MKSNEKIWDVVEILTHSRHDWMNRLQIIKGNMSLNRYDRVEAIIEEIVAEAQNESRLCNMKMNNFAGLLMTFNWENHHFTLEYEILDDSGDASRHDDVLTKWTSGLLNLLDEAVDRCAENHLCITVEMSGGLPRFFFDFNGIINGEEKLKGFFSAELKTRLAVEQYNVASHEMTAMVTISS
ncbi:sporulation protein [Bacillus lacus]|uniref:Sporulation protein n=1 Tax=Metabacillus lacus TaxID=1983721 RepID=A0A7X2IXR7_9BACI|nr:sporulation initiation phosphotransferase B [Metabacillus lacus]MRX71412.1 sporulation protein [Metabacillus lacus]